MVLPLALCIWTDLFEGGYQLQTHITYLVPLNVLQKEGIAFQVLIREVELKLRGYFLPQFSWWWSPGLTLTSFFLKHISQLCRTSEKQRSFLS